MTRIRRLVRFVPGAPEWERLAFGRDLLKALDEAGVQPGQSFSVTPANGRAPAATDANQLGGFTAETARKAALDNYPRSGNQRHRVFVTVVAAGEYGATSEEIARRLGMLLYSVKPRLTELREGGWVARTGNTRPSPTGSAVDVYVATAKGVRAFLEHEPLVVR